MGKELNGISYASPVASAQVKSAVMLAGLYAAGETRVTEGRTNADGRFDRPLLEGAAFAFGTYRLDFFVGEYFRANGVTLADPAFLDVVPVRFGIAERTHYHVPLLVAPYGYSTYRGS